jgi:hypothetical protein
MDYNEAKSLVIAKLRGQEVDKAELLQALKEYPSMGKKLKGLWGWLVTEMEDEENCPECGGPCNGHDGSPSAQAFDKCVEEEVI